MRNKKPQDIVFLKEFISGKKFLILSPSDTVREAARQMPRTHSSAAVVVRDGELVGIVTERDIVEKVVAKNRDPETVSVRDIMSSEPIMISANQSISEALAVLTRHHVRTLPVVEGNKFIGIIDIRDLYEGVNKLLEEQLKADDSLIAYCFGEAYGIGSA